MGIVVTWWECSWAIVQVMVVEIGRKDSGAVVNLVVVSWRECSWAVIYVMVVGIRWGYGRPVVYVVIVEVVVWGVSVIDVRPVDGSSYAVAVLQITVATLMVVR